MSGPLVVKRPCLVVELTYSDDWLDVLHQRLDAARIVNRRNALVTDHMGVEVKPFGSAACHLDPDRFPIRVFHLDKWYAPEVRAPGLERARSKELSERQSDHSSSDGSPSPTTSPASRKDSRELQFEDVWPGILQIKLQAVVGVAEDGDLRGLAATDSTGVEIDLCRRDRLPDAARFPLKLHFRAHGASTRQNLEETPQGSVGVGQMSQGMSQGSSFSCEDDKAGRFASKGCRDHSTELQLENILPDVISNRMREMGSTGRATRSLCILVTDRIGVQVCIPGDIPERSRFPLKLHIDDSGPSGRDQRMTAGASMGPRATLKSMNQKSRSFLKRGLSKLSGASGH